MTKNTAQQKRNQILLLPTRHHFVSTKAIFFNLGKTDFFVVMQNNIPMREDKSVYKPIKVVDLRDKILPELNSKGIQLLTILVELQKEATSENRELHLCHNG